MFCSINSSNAAFRLSFHNRFVTFYCPADVTLFKVGPEIRCSGVSSRYCCYANHTACSNQILKLFIVVNGELNKVSLCQK